MLQINKKNKKQQKCVKNFLRIDVCLSLDILVILFGGCCTKINHKNNFNLSSFHFDVDKFWVIWVLGYSKYENIPCVSDI